MAKFLLHSTDHKPIYSAGHVPVFGFAPERLEIWHSLPAIWYRVVYSLDDLTAEDPRFRSISREAVEFSSVTSPWRKEYTTVDLVDGEHHGFAANSLGLFRYYILAWGVKYYDEDDNFYFESNDGPFTIRASVGSLVAEYNVTSIPQWEWKDGTGVISGGAFPAASLVVATVYYNQQGHNLSIS
jgi:hypothetical protein